MLTGSGCLATKSQILRQSLTPIPADAQGWLYVATNKAIPVGVEGSKTIAREDVGGYYLVHKNDLEALMQAIRSGKDARLLADWLALQPGGDRLLQAYQAWQASQTSTAEAIPH